MIINDAWLEELVEQGPDVIFDEIKVHLNKEVYRINPKQFDRWTNLIMDRVLDEDLYDFSDENEVDTYFHEVAAKVLIHLAKISNFKSNTCLKHIKTFQETDILLSAAASDNVDMLSIFNNLSYPAIRRILIGFPASYAWTIESNSSIYAQIPKSIEGIHTLSEGIKSSSPASALTYQYDLVTAIKCILESVDITPELAKQASYALSLKHINYGEEITTSQIEIFDKIEELIKPFICIEKLDQKLQYAVLTGTLGSYECWSVLIDENMLSKQETIPFEM